MATSELRVFSDGREPQEAAKALVLPRRERCILAEWISNRACLVTKGQIFNDVHGLFRDRDENVLESGVSRLHKRCAIVSAVAPSILSELARSGDGFERISNARTCFAC